MKPYSYYALFISTLLVRDKEYVGDGGIRGAESDIDYFLTQPDFPAPVQDLEVDKINYTTLNFTWKPPSGTLITRDKCIMCVSLKFRPP